MVLTERSLAYRGTRRGEVVERVTIGKKGVVSRSFTQPGSTEAKPTVKSSGSIAPTLPEEKKETITPTTSTTSTQKEKVLIAKKTPVKEPLPIPPPGRTYGRGEILVRPGGIQIITEETITNKRTPVTEYYRNRPTGRGPETVPTLEITAKKRVLVPNQLLAEEERSKEGKYREYSGEAKKSITFDVVQPLSYDEKLYAFTRSYTEPYVEERKEFFQAEQAKLVAWAGTSRTRQALIAFPMQYTTIEYDFPERVSKNLVTGGLIATGAVVLTVAAPVIIGTSINPAVLNAAKNLGSAALYTYAGVRGLEYVTGQPTFGQSIQALGRGIDIVSPESNIRRGQVLSKTGFELGFILAGTSIGKGINQFVQKPTRFDYVRVGQKSAGQTTEESGTFKSIDWERSSLKTGQFRIEQFRTGTKATSTVYFGEEQIGSYSGIVERFPLDLIRGKTIPKGFMSSESTLSNSWSEYRFEYAGTSMVEMQGMIDERLFFEKTPSLVTTYTLKEISVSDTIGTIVASPRIIEGVDVPVEGFSVTPKGLIVLAGGEPVGKEAFIQPVFSGKIGANKFEPMTVGGMSPNSVFVIESVPPKVESVQLVSYTSRGSLTITPKIDLGKSGSVFTEQVGKIKSDVVNLGSQVGIPSPKFALSQGLNLIGGFVSSIGTNISLVTPLLVGGNVDVRSRSTVFSIPNVKIKARVESVNVPRRAIDDISLSSRISMQQQGIPTSTGGGKVQIQVPSEIVPPSVIVPVVPAPEIVPPPPSISIPFVGLSANVQRFPRKKKEKKEKVVWKGAYEPSIGGVLLPLKSTPQIRKWAELTGIQFRPKVR